MSPHGQYLLEEARAYMARLIDKGVTPTEAAQKAGDWFGFHPSTVTGSAA